MTEVSDESKTVIDAKQNIASTTKTNDVKLKIPKPGEVPALEIDDVVVDHLKTRDNVLLIEPKEGEPYWRSVNYGKISHNEWLILQKCKTDPDGTYEYYKKLLIYSSISPKFTEDLFKEKKVDSDFFIAYSRLIEIYLQECRFL